MITDEKTVYVEKFCASCGKFKPPYGVWKTIFSKDRKTRRKRCPDCTNKAEAIKSLK